MPVIAMKSLSIAVILAFSAGAAADIDVEDNYYLSCDGLDTPIWGDCYGTYADLQDHSYDPYPNDYPQCTVFIPENSTSLDCVIEYCPPNADMAINGIAITAGYEVIEICKQDGLGGQYTDLRNGSTYGLNVSVTANQDYIPSSSVSSAGRLPPSTNLEDRKHARNLTVRQEDSDTGYTILEKAVNVPIRANRKYVVGPIGPESTYTIQESDSQSIGISSSVSVEAGFFDIFEASASLSVSYDHTTTSTSGIMEVCDCQSGQQCVIYWQPLYTIYYGFYTPSQEDLDWYIPEDNQSSYDHDCIGDAQEIVSR